MWDINLNVVSAISEEISQSSFSTKEHIPVINCGLIDFKNKLGFASGGFSRVFFGKYKHRKIAVKMVRVYFTSYLYT
jgi:hypothetical protein